MLIVLPPLPVSDHSSRRRGLRVSALVSLSLLTFVITQKDAEARLQSTDHGTTLDIGEGLPNVDSVHFWTTCMNHLPSQMRVSGINPSIASSSCPRISEQGCSAGACGGGFINPNVGNSGFAALEPSRVGVETPDALLEEDYSTIDMFSFNYIHYADDLRSADGTWRTAGLRRILRTRDMTVPGSAFGPGTFSQYDFRLMFSLYQGGSCEAFDPNLLYPQKLAKSTDGTVGEYAPSNANWRSSGDTAATQTTAGRPVWLRLHDAAGQLAAPSSAVEAIWKAPGGLTVRFEIIDVGDLRPVARRTPLNRLALKTFLTTPADLSALRTTPAAA